MTPDIYPAEMGWEKLEEYVERLVSIFKDKPYRKIIENPEITCKSISSLFKEGWRVELLEYDKGLGGLCYPENKEITLNKSFVKYQRDKVLFHELVHAHYPGELSDAGLEWNADTHNAIVDYLARIHRANPVLLKHAIETFGLEPYIYDRPSFLAFSPLKEEMLERQMVFDFAKKDYSIFRKKYLDTTIMHGC